MSVLSLCLVCCASFSGVNHKLGGQFMLPTSSHLSLPHTHLALAWHEHFSLVDQWHFLIHLSICTSCDLGTEATLKLQQFIKSFLSYYLSHQSTAPTQCCSVVFNLESLPIAVILFLLLKIFHLKTYILHTSGHILHSLAVILAVSIIDYPFVTSSVNLNSALIILCLLFWGKCQLQVCNFTGAFLRRIQMFRSLTFTMIITMMMMMNALNNILLPNTQLFKDDFISLLSYNFPSWAGFLPSLTVSFPLKIVV